MPFAVFRRHQRKLLAIFAILAMFGFVLADSLPRLLNAGYGGANQNPTVVTLYGRPVRQADINEMAVQRNNANLFMSTLMMSNRPVFGDINTRSIVDALILEHEADKLRIPSGPEAGREWLKQATNGIMNRDLFESTLARFGNRISGEQMLSDIANQVRIAKVRQLLGSPVVTPLDVYQAFRDQNERVSARALAFPVEGFLAKVPEPTATQVRDSYEKYKDVLPDPSRDSPGFKVPRQVRAEVLSLDGNALARGIKDKLTEAELLTNYENRKLEFKKPSEFPDDLFANDPKAELTPPSVQTFEDVRPSLAVALADEKAQAEIVSKFGRIKDEEMIPFADRYFDAVENHEENRKQGKPATEALPAWKDLKSLAAKEGLDHELTPPLTREQAEHYGEVANAEVGLTKLSGGRKFAAELFDPKTTLFEPVEMTDALGRRYLVRKIEDDAPRVPPLEEIRPEVILAWKTEQARPLAEKAAGALADQLRKAGGKIKGESIEGHPVVTTNMVSRLEPGFPIPGQYFQMGPPTESEIPQIPNASRALRDAYFNLQDGSVAVAPNQPRTTYYVLTLDRRLPAPFEALYAPNGEYFRYRNEAMTDAMRRREDEWMNSLRSQAGLPSDWTPRDEKRDTVASQG